MTTSSPAFAADSTDPAFSRLGQTATFRAGGLSAWRRARVAVVGIGVLGSRLAVEAVRSGARALLIDPDLGEAHNLGTQAVVTDEPKAETVAAACNAVRPGAAEARACDVRHVGIGELRTCDLLVDCTDDPALALPLTRISNGLGRPLVRVAVDGSGQYELGRVLVSHGGDGHACQLCSTRQEDLVGRARTPCRPEGPERPPTLAGGAIASAIVGLALLQAQRIVTGNDLATVFDHETVLDLTHGQLLQIAHPRRDDCLSGHVPWRLVEVGESATAWTVGDALARAEREFGVTRLAIEPYLHPLLVGASCACGTHVTTVGTRWLPPPACHRCGGPTTRGPIEVRRLARSHVDALGLGDRTWAELGLPQRGAMLVVHAESGPLTRWILS